MLALTSPQVLLPLLGAVAVGALVFLVWSHTQSSQPAGFGASLAPLQNLPTVQLALKAIVSRMEQIDQETQHQLLDAAVLKMLPALAPLVPLLNRVLDKVESATPPKTP